MKDINNIWKNIKIEPLNNWTNSANTLMEKINYTHCNGGIQLHKYKIIGAEDIIWSSTNNALFSPINPLERNNFIETILKNNNLNIYRNDLEINNDDIKIKYLEYYTDIYELSGILGRIMGYGGAYYKLEPEIAWDTANKFVKDELGNRFEEYNMFIVNIKNAEWFYDIAWDITIIILGKIKNEIIFIDITDTD
ncbi:hypothetical protein FACS1894172_07900 [Spirochaetia bacterium]|nr:hypothetical protein FACS1894164_06020 [Spirochaetia bacterium]GHU32013.1 hypothetical protein FACS1894172_07900 [Spirochaetia bacterium]